MVSHFESCNLSFRTVRINGLSVRDFTDMDQEIEQLAQSSAIADDIHPDHAQSFRGLWRRLNRHFMSDHRARIDMSFQHGRIERQACGFRQEDPVLLRH